MTISILLAFVSASILIFLFYRHLGEIKGLPAEEIERKIREGESPFHEIEEKIFTPARTWFSRHLPLAALKTSEIAVKETRRVLLRLASGLGEIHDYLRGRKIHLNGERKSAYWSEIHEKVRNSRKGAEKTPE